MHNQEDLKLENVLRKAAIAIGVTLLIFSIYLSYDGFDQSVSGTNPNYTILASAIGVALAVTFSVLEFIVSTRNEALNTTLRVLGLAAYVYSIYTNFLGAQHLLHMGTFMAAITGFTMDIVPEPLIAWGLGEAIMHDLFGNLGKFAVAPVGKSAKGGGGNNHQNNNHQQKGGGGGGQHRPQGQPFPQSHGGGSDRRRQLEMAARGNGHNKGHEEEEDTGPIFR